MPPRGRRPGSGNAKSADRSDTLVVGIIGKGEVDSAEVEAMMNDLFQTPKISKVEVVFSLTDDSVDDSLWDAFEIVAENVGDELALAAVTNEGGSKDDKDLHTEALDRKARIVAVQGQDLASVVVADELIKAKGDGAETLLVVFWVATEDPDEDPGGQYAAIETAITGGVKAKNACQGMDDILLGDDQAEETGPIGDTPAEAAEEPKRRGRRPAADAEDAPADKPAEEEPPRRRRGRPSNAEKAAAAEAEAQSAPAASSTADEAQSTQLEDVGMFSLFAKAVAREIVKLLQAGDTGVLGGSDDKPARRGRRA